MKTIMKSLALVPAFALAAVANADVYTPASAQTELTASVSTWGGVAVAVTIAVVGFLIIFKMLRKSH